MFGRSANAVGLRNVIRWTFLGLVAISLPGVIEYLVMDCFLCPKQFRYTVKDPASEFTEYTKLRWPETAVIVSVGDDHGGFHGDGKFHLVFDADEETLERWLISPPPWGDAEWQNGPVPDRIAECGFLSVKNESTYRSGLAQSQIWYCAEDFHRSQIDWHNGRLLAIDPIAGRVYLTWWDF